MAVTLGVPGIGVAKSRFIVTFAEPARAAGLVVPLMDKPEQVGVVLRTQAGVTRCSSASATAWICLPPLRWCSTAAGSGSPNRPDWRTRRWPS
jgi:deoxyinosine 3'endonuclease (endonuclease V)